MFVCSILHISISICEQSILHCISVCVCHFSLYQRVHMCSCVYFTSFWIGVYRCVCVHHFPVLVFWVNHSLKRALGSCPPPFQSACHHCCCSKFSLSWFWPQLGQSFSPVSMLTAGENCIFFCVLSIRPQLLLLSLARPFCCRVGPSLSCTVWMQSYQGQHSFVRPYFSFGLGGRLVTALSAEAVWEFSPV